MPAGLSFNGLVVAVAQADHRIVVAGYGSDTAAPNATVALVCRLRASGAFDTEFAAGAGFKLLDMP